MVGCCLFFISFHLFFFKKGLFSISINSINSQVDAKEMTKHSQCSCCCCFEGLSEKQTCHFSFWQLPMSLIGQLVFFFSPPRSTSVSLFRLRFESSRHRLCHSVHPREQSHWNHQRTEHFPLSREKRSALEGALPWPRLNSFCNITGYIVLSHVRVFTLLPPSSEEWGHRSGSTRCLVLAL